MEFRILGPLEVVDGGRRLPVSGPKQRALLAVLCLHANEVVSSGRLSEALWGGRPPETAQATLQMHVSQLRKLLGPDRIQTRAPGYRLRVEAGELDLARFEQLLRGGQVREALALWRGPALGDLADAPLARGPAARLEELRLTALEERIEEDLALGRRGPLVGELEQLVREQPLRERFRAQLMLALYHSGRQAEALALYQATRRLLVEELGIEPGPALQALHRQVLNQDPALAPPPPAEDAPPPPQPREERKVVTVLFCDLVGFTARAEQLDPEDVSALLSRYHGRLRAELERHGGTVEKFIGDAVMALFGAPVAHEDDAVRAVRAALAIRDWSVEHEDELEVRIGLDTGEALVRLDADPDAGMAAGDVVNTAARLQQAAPPGAVVVGAATYRATRDAIAYERLAPAELKGKAMPVMLWRAEHPVALGRPAMPFVGRDQDLALLEQTYARALRESSVQLVTIVGEPGIGKTRLVGELRALVEGQPDELLWRHGRCLAYGDGITFWALGQIVKEQAGILESDSPQDASAKLATAIERVAEAADRPWLQARLAPLIGPASDETVEQTEAFTAWRTFLEGIAAAQPLVLVIEDLHWADSALLAFLEHLVDWATDVPLLVLATARPELYERVSGWGGGKRNSTTIALRPLTDDETQRLVADLLSQAALPDETQAALLERAGGNPLYAEEFVRMLGDRGLLTRRRESVQIAVGADIPVPDGIHAVIAARLDTLSPDRKALLQDASVVGKVFWAGALASMSGIAAESALAGLHELGRKELVRRARSSSIAGDVEYTFWHALVRDVAYGQIPRAARARKHVAAADWIERIAGERVTDHAEFLATHYAMALELAHAAGDVGQAQKLTDAAVRFGVLAAERAIRLDPSHGERYYRRTLALLPDDDPLRPRLLADAADAGTTAGRSFEETKPELEEAIAKLRARGDIVAAANAMRQLSHLMWDAGESGESRLALADEARRLLERGPPGPERALVYARIAQEHVFAGHARETIEWAEKALPLLEQFGLDDEALRTRTRVALSRCSLGDLGGIDDLRKITREAVENDPGYGTFATCAALNNLASCEQWFGAGPAAAVELLQEAFELASRRGLERPSMFYRGGLSDPLYDLGEWDAVLHIAEEVVAWEGVRGRAMSGVISAPFAARVLTARGELAAAAALVEELLPRTRQLQDAQNLLPTLVAAAALEAAARELSHAVSFVDEFEQLATDVSHVLGYIAAIGRVCAQTDNLAPLERLLDTATDLDPRLERFVSTGHAILAEARAEHDRAGSLYAQAERSWSEYGCVVERAYALLGLGRCRLALDRPDAKGPLHEAREIFTRLRAQPLVAATDDLLGHTTATPRT